MTIELDSLRVRLENIQKKVTVLVARENNYYDLGNYSYLWTNFGRILKLLKGQYPGTFDDIPDRLPKTDEVRFEEVILFDSVELLAGDVEDCLSYLNLLPEESSKISITSSETQTIPEYLRRDIFDFITVGLSNFHGRLDEIDFLSRLYDLKSIQSTDQRFKDALGDIQQHRLNNLDWEDSWIFKDARFGLLKGPDNVLLDFLCLMVHPVVRDDGEASNLVEEFNKYLSKAGWLITTQTTIAGRATYGAVRSYSILLKSHSDSLHKTLDTEYISKLLNRMHSSVSSDPELAIGSAKELIESVCRTVLNDKGIVFSKEDSVQQLLKKTLLELKLEPDNMPPTTKALDSIRPLLKSLATIAHMTAELRGQFGTGHGKDARTKGLGPRHAKLAVGAASSVAVFLFETYMERQKTESNSPSTDSSTDFVNVVQ